MQLHDITETRGGISEGPTLQVALFTFSNKIHLNKYFINEIVGMIETDEDALAGFL